MIVFQSGCKKRDDLISLNTGTIEPTDLFYTDTITVLSSTVREDSIPTRMSSNQQLAGKMNDLLFGISESSIFSQVRLAILNNPISPVTGADSAFIYLTFTSEIASYGNLNSTQHFSVYELNADLDASKTYYSTDSISYNQTEIGSYSGSFNLVDSVRVKDSTFSNTAPGIKIALTKDFANKLINAGPGDVNTQSSFANYIKGLCIKPTGNPASGEGAVVGFNFKAVSTQIHVYYDGDKHINFLLDSAAVKFSQYKFSQQPANITIQKNNPLLNFDTTYVQALTGAKTFFRFPNLFSLAKDNKIFIHKAELIIPVYKDVISSQYKAPTRLLLNQPDELTGRNLPLIDLISSESTYGGKYDVALGQYKFTITRHIQDLFSSYLNDGDNFNFGLYLTNTIDLPITASRILIDTRKSNPIEQRLRLVIIYSKL
ncbi:MAG: DUF4270 family protein [Bacteroidetes bacterium]|nr:DUF4270 family protein [Bacteroidota bacterium]